MTKAKKQSTSTLQSSIKIVDGKLILSLPNAQTPVVWQMDLESAQSAAFTVQENKKAKTFSLILKKENGETDEIAPFEDKETAIAVLMETSEALQSAHGQIKTSAATQQSNQQQPAAANSNAQGSDKLGAFLAACLVLVLIGVWMISSSVPNKIAGTNGVSTAGTSNANASPRQSAGVAVSADDFLSNR